jgi:hypothetical protein
MSNFTARSRTSKTDESLQRIALLLRWTHPWLTERPLTAQRRQALPCAAVALQSRDRSGRERPREKMGRCPSHREGSARVRSRGLHRNRWGTGSTGQGGDVKTREGIARLHTGRCIHTRPCVGRGCAGAGARGSGIMFSTMRNPLVAIGAGDHCPSKLVSPVLPSCLSRDHTDCSVRRFSLRSIQHKSTRRPPQCAGNGLCALSVSASTVRLSRDRLSGVHVSLWFGY